MKKLLCTLLALSCSWGWPPAAAPRPRRAPPQTPRRRCPPPARAWSSPRSSFTDSVGRTVEVPAEITSVAVSGPLAQMVIFALCPDKLVGIADEWDASAEQYLATEYYNLPLLGQLYGGKGELNLETLLGSGAQVVIDVGEPKDTIVEDLDALQEQTGIPFVHVSATIETMGDAYIGSWASCWAWRRRPRRWGRPTATRPTPWVKDVAEHVEKANLLYITGDAGLNVIAQGSYHAEIIDLLSNNLAVVDSPSSKGTGNEVDMEQLMLWNPDVILFAPDSVYASVGDDPGWAEPHRHPELAATMRPPWAPTTGWAFRPPSSGIWVCCGWQSSSTPTRRITTSRPR